MKLVFGMPEYVVSSNAVVCKLDGSIDEYSLSYHTEQVAYPIDGDTFDVTTGKRVARAKAELDLYKKAKVDLKHIKRNCNDVISTCDNTIDELDSFIEHNKKYLGEF